MKKNYQNVIIGLFLILSISLLNSCKDKEDDVEVDMASSDRVTGEWKVVETNDLNSKIENYSSTITRLNDSTIKVKSDLVNPPDYHLSEFNIRVYWATKKFSGSPTTLRGTIKNENDFEIVYDTGNGSGVVTVVQHYTRK